MSLGIYNVRKWHQPYASLIVSGMGFALVVYGCATFSRPGSRYDLLIGIAVQAIGSLQRIVRRVRSNEIPRR